MLVQDLAPSSTCRHAQHRYAAAIIALWSLGAGLCRAIEGREKGGKEGGEQGEAKASTS